MPFRGQLIRREMEILIRRIGEENEEEDVSFRMRWGIIENSLKDPRIEEHVSRWEWSKRYQEGRKRMFHVFTVVEWDPLAFFPCHFLLLFHFFFVLLTSCLLNIFRTPLPKNLFEFVKPQVGSYGYSEDGNQHDIPRIDTWKRVFQMNCCNLCKTCASRIIHKMERKGCMMIIWMGEKS